MKKKPVTIEDIDAKVSALADTVSSILVGAASADELPDREPFTCKGETVIFRFAKFLVEGEILYAHEVQADKTLREKLIEQYPNLIQPTT